MCWCSSSCLLVEHDLDVVAERTNKRNNIFLGFRKQAKKNHIKLSYSKSNESMKVTNFLYTFHKQHWRTVSKNKWGNTPDWGDSFESYERSSAGQRYYFGGALTVLSWRQAHLHPHPATVKSNNIYKSQKIFEIPEMENGSHPEYILLNCTLTTRSLGSVPSSRTSYNLQPASFTFLYQVNLN